MAAAATPSCGREEVTKRLELDAEKGAFLTRSERGGKRFDISRVSAARDVSADQPGGHSV